jgi:hypothetical protein
MRRGQGLPGGFGIAEQPRPGRRPRKLTGKFAKQETVAVSRIQEEAFQC